MHRTTADEVLLRSRSELDLLASFPGRSALAVLGLLACLVFRPSLAQFDPPERLVVAHAAAWTPYAFLGAGDEPKGLLIDLWRLFGEKNNVEIVFRLVDWSETLDMVRRGDADVHGGLTISDARDEYLDFSREVARIRTLLFIPSDADDEDLADMTDKPVAVVAATFDQDFIETHFPQVRIRTFPSSEQMIAAALRNDVHAFVANRRAFYDKAGQEIERVKRYARPLALVLFDLDHFKQVNDRFGHLLGDEVLKGFVGAVNATLREADFFARLGGDEFVALLPETSHNDAVLLARRVLVALRARRFDPTGEGIELSFSTGVAEFEGNGSIDDRISRADTRLYRSKTEGRAQVNSG